MRLAQAWMILSLIAALPSVSEAQLAFALGSGSADDARGIAVDTAGNVFVTGAFNGTVDFDPGPGLFELNAGISEAAFLASYASDGTFRYALAFPGEGESVVTDPSGNAYITGTLRGGIADLDPGPGQQLVNPAAGRVFLASYGPSGNLRFGFNFGGGVSNLVESGFSLALDSASNVFITGVINGLTDFDPDINGVLLVPVDGNTDGFLASYTNTGGLRFAFGLGGRFTDAGYGVAVDGNDACYVAGAFRDSLDFNPTLSTAYEVSAGDQDLYLASYTNGGAYRFAHAFGSASTETATSVAADAVGNSYLTGFVRGDTDFDPGVGVALVSPGTSEDAFLASYTSSGSYRFSFGLGNNRATQGLAVVLGPDDGPILTGFFSGPIEMDPGPQTQILDGTNDTFVVSYDGGGAFRFAYNFPDVGTAFSDQGKAIAIGPMGRVHVAGSFGGTLDLDPIAGGLPVTSLGSTDAFLARVEASVVSVGPWTQSRGLALRLGPNPASGLTRVNLAARREGRLIVDLFDIAGRRVARLRDRFATAGMEDGWDQPLGQFANGVYLMRATLAGQSVTQKLLVIR